ncbi:hypothetical protein [Streptomyces sp. NPDC058451]|uniref:hypothetical protein n=1 Tax=Streptomyces sp. NPDC058451 TaxID=3346506 RepID=UPI003655C585
MREIATLVREASFISRCQQRYTAAGFGVPGRGEVRSWRKSWPALLDALMRAGLGDLQLYLEYGTPGGVRRLDALLLGAASDGALGMVVVELKQWRDCEVLEGGDRVRRSDGEVTAHPVYQVAAYRSFFQHWRPRAAPVLDLRAVVLQHNAPPKRARPWPSMTRWGPIFPSSPATT